MEDEGRREVEEEMRRKRNDERKTKKEERQKRNTILYLQTLFCRQMHFRRRHVVTCKQVGSQHWIAGCQDNYVTQFRYNLMMQKPLYAWYRSHVNTLTVEREREKQAKRQTSGRRHGRTGKLNRDTRVKWFQGLDFDFEVMFVAVSTGPFFFFPPLFSFFAVAPLPFHVCFRASPNITF